jgi:hypothetical protein
LFGSVPDAADDGAQNALPSKAPVIWSTPAGANVLVHVPVPLLTVALHTAWPLANKFAPTPEGAGPDDAVTVIVYITGSP